MAQTDENHLTIPINQQGPFPKINAFFDAADLVVERTERLLTKAKPLVYNLALFIFLILSLASYGLYLLSKWYWSG